MNILSRPDLVDRLAASYALGTLRGAARRRFETLARQSPAARARIVIWQEHFAAMAELQPAATPNPLVWKRIEDAIRQDARFEQTASAPDASMLQGLRRRLALWRGFTAAAALATVAALAVVVQLQSRPEIQYVAVLQDNGQNASVLVTFDPNKQRLTLKRIGGYQEAADRSLELWALPPGQAPKSLGVMEGRPVMQLTAGSRDVTTAPTLAITLEPKGGAPGGKPTGPILFKGALLQTTL